MIERVEVGAYRIPTDDAEADGTFRWESTGMIVVHIAGGGTTGLGYSYTAPAAARLVADMLAGRIKGMSALAPLGVFESMLEAVRNIGDSALTMTAVAAVDAAVWDLKAKVMGVPLALLLGKVRDEVPVYGSGGFTSYTPKKLRTQLENWIDSGIPRVKMKVGADPEEDPQRVREARAVIGDHGALFVDANGGYSRKLALKMADVFASCGVSWFEEPVVYHDRDGLAFVRDHAPPGIDISAGEYGFRLRHFRELLEKGCIDVLQADATRCGVTGFLQAATLADAFYTELSSHCAPSLHLQLCIALPNVRHMEYFHDHVRIERLLFDGFRPQHEGTMIPDLSRPGLGIELKGKDADRYAVSW